MLVSGRHVSAQPNESPRGAAPPLALPLPAATPDPEAYRLAPHRIRRCTFRRIIHIDSVDERLYDVECLYPDRRVPVPLGDLDSATPICNSCTAAHIFRPDED
jgi:hypothetical protein